MHLPEGTYQGEIVKWKLFTATTGTPCLEITIRVSGGETKDGDEVEPGRPVNRRVPVWLTEKAKGRRYEAFKELGYEDESLDRLDPKHPDRFDLSGKKVTLRISHKLYQGRMVEDISFGSQPRRLSADKIDSAELKAMFAAACQRDKAGG